MEAAGSAIQTTLSLKWKFFPNSVEALTGLLNGEVDAVCGYFAPDGTFPFPGTGELVSRALVF